MVPTECAHEGELLEALRTCAWPDRCEAEFVAHVESCEACASLVAVVLPLLDEHRAGMAEASVPPAGVVWWRAQVRARQEAERSAARPITIAQGISVACAGGLIATAIGFVSPAFRSLVAWLVEAALTGGAAVAALAAHLPALDWPELQVLGPLGLTAIAGLMTLSILAPLAIYLARD